MLRNNSKGITLLEAFLSAFIFVISVAAIFATLNSLRKPAVNNELAIGAALAASNVLEDLRSKVDARDMETSDVWTDGEHGPITVGIYSVYYNVVKDATTGVRQVNASVTWPD